MKDLSNTQFFQVESGPQIQAKDILEIVYKALSEKGYNPVNQIVGYIMSGDPTYITSYNGARSLIMKMERDELVEEMLRRISSIISGDNIYENHGAGLWYEDGWCSNQRCAWDYCSGSRDNYPERRE